MAGAHLAVDSHHAVALVGAAGPFPALGWFTGWGVGAQALLDSGAAQAGFDGFIQVHAAAFAVVVGVAVSAVFCGEFAVFDCACDVHIHVFHFIYRADRTGRFK